MPLGLVSVVAVLSQELRGARVSRRISYGSSLVSTSGALFVDHSAFAYTIRGTTPEVPAPTAVVFMRPWRSGGEL